MHLDQKRRLIFRDTTADAYGEFPDEFRRRYAAARPDVGAWRVFDRLEDRLLNDAEVSLLSIDELVQEFGHA
jgi:hypothetical protein